MTKWIDLQDGGELVEVTDELRRVRRVEQEIAAMTASLGRASRADRVEPGALAATEQTLAERSANAGWGSHPDGARIKAAMEAGGIEWPPM
jgi:hypothetical protein